MAKLKIGDKVIHYAEGTGNKGTITGKASVDGTLVTVKLKKSKAIITTNVKNLVYKKSKK